MPKLVTAVLFGFIITACGSVNGDFCKAERECEGGNEKDEAACVAERDGETNAAEEYGCRDQHETWMTRRRYEVPPLRSLWVAPRPER